MAYTSATYDEVKEFLDKMRTCLTFMGGQVLYDTRGKNLIRCGSSGICICH